MMTIASQNEYFSQTFTSVEASGEEFSDTVFESCNFHSCNFSEVIFHKCKFIDCTFTACNLSNAVMKFSRFSEAGFAECKLVGIDWTKADWPRLNLTSPLQFNQCIMNDASFFGLNLSEIKMVHCKAHDVDFRNGTFTKADFTYTDFSHSLFAKTDLKEADFSEAENYDINIFDNDIKAAIFTRYEAVRLLNCLDIELRD